MAYRKDKKKQAQKDLLQKRRDATFIAEYVKRKSPETYVEAENFLKKLRELYPNKRDHTKTHEFLVDTTAYVDHKEYYNRKRLRHLNQDTTSSTTSVNTASSTTSVNTTSSTTSVNTTSRTTSVNTSSSTTSVNNMTLNIALMPETVVAENTVPLQAIPQEIYKDLITEIVSDPALHDIFHDFDNMQDIELDEAITGLSPLERELLGNN